MKKFFSIILGAVLLVGLTAQAQIGTGGSGSATVAYSQAAAATVTYGSQSWTNTIVASTSFTNMTPINCVGKRQLRLQTRVQCDAAGSGTQEMRVWLYGNNDGVGTGSWAGVNTNVVFLGVVTNTLGGTTWTTSLNTPLTVYGGTLPPYVYIGTISNCAVTAGITNFVMKAYLD